MAHAVKAPHARRLDQLGGTRQHAAFAGGQVLGRVERERDQVRLVEAGRRGADHPVVIPGRQRVGRVLDHGQAVPVRDVVDRVHVRRVPVKVHGHDRPHAGRPAHRMLDLVGVEVERVGLDVDQHRARALVLDHVDCGGECHRRGHDRVAVADAQGRQREVHRRGRRVDGQRVGRADEVAELFFELVRPLTGGDPAAPQGAHHLGDVFLADQRWGERKELRAHQAPSGWRSNPMRWLRSGLNQDSIG